MQRKIFVYVGFLMVLFVTVNLSLASTPPTGINDLRQSVLALDNAWTRAIEDLQHKKSSGALEASAKQDYAKFITYLSSRIDHYCTLLRTEGGEQAVEDLPCTASNSIESLPVQPSSLTKTEQVAELDKSLSEALGEFDEQLLGEEQRISARTPSARESGRSYGSKNGTGYSGQYGSGHSVDAGKAGKAGTMKEEGASQKGYGSAQNKNGSTTSSHGEGSGKGSKEQRDDSRTGTQEIESGYDDIVARQLKEAAENETDPELQKKLWEEYRKYKEGIN